MFEIIALAITVTVFMAVSMSLISSVKPGGERIATVIFVSILAGVVVGEAAYRIASEAREQGLSANQAGLIATEVSQSGGQETLDVLVLGTILADGPMTEWRDGFVLVDFITFAPQGNEGTLVRWCFDEVEGKAICSTIVN